MLGLDNDKFVSVEEQVCFQYAMLCNEHAVDYAFPLDQSACRSALAMALRKPGSDPSRPNVDAYANNHCRSKTTCSDYLDCLAASNFIASPSTCATSDCLPNEGGAMAPWKCCTGEQCMQRENASGCLDPSKWGCIGSVVFPQPDPADAGTVPLSITFVDLNNPMQQVNDLTVRVCSRLDVGCSSPVDTSPTTTNPHMLKVPYAFNGYIEATYNAPDGGPDQDYMPLLVMFASPVTAQVATQMQMGGLPMFRRIAFNQILGSIGDTANPNDGHLFVNARDCMFDAGANATGSLDVDAGRIMYFVGMQPTLMKMETDVGGLFGFINVPKGLRELTIDVRSVRTGSASVVVRANTLTFIYLPPTP